MLAPIVSHRAPTVTLHHLFPEEGDSMRAGKERGRAGHLARLSGRPE